MERHQPNDTLLATIPRIDFIPHLAEMAEGNIDFEDLKIQNPDIRMVTANDVNADSTKKVPVMKELPAINIGKLELVNPSLHLDIAGRGFWSVLATRGNESLNFVRIRDIQAKKGGSLRVGDLRAHIDSLSMKTNNSSVTVNKEGNIKAHINKASFTPASNNEKTRWAFHLNSLSAHHLQFAREHEGKKMNLLVRDAELDSVSLQSHQLNVHSIITASPGLALNRISAALHTQNNYFHFGNVVYSKKRKSASIDSFYYSPAISRDSFMAASAYETQFIQGSTGKISITGIDLGAYLADSVLDLGKIEINQPVLSIYKDKTRPFNPAAVHLLPVNLVKNIPVPFTVDTVSIVDGKVFYTERSKKTKLDAPFHLTRLNAVLYPVKNYGVSGTDSLRLRAEAHLMDTAWVRLRMQESYTDSLSGFVLLAEMRSAPLTFMNPMVQPLASVKLTSGKLDSMHMHAVGREYLSIGKMHMHYKGLKVAMLKHGKEGKSDFFTDFKTFAANRIIKTNNKKRVGQVYFERDRYRSIINYWVKMTLSGVATSVGVKHSRKYQKEYKKQLENLKLPPINF